MKGVKNICTVYTLYSVHPVQCTLYTLYRVYIYPQAKGINPYAQYLLHIYFLQRMKDAEYLYSFPPGTITNCCTLSLET